MKNYEMSEEDFCFLKGDTKCAYPARRRVYWQFLYVGLPNCLAACQLQEPVMTIALFEDARDVGKRTRPKPSDPMPWNTYLLIEINIPQSGEVKYLARASRYSRPGATQQSWRARSVWTSVISSSALIWLSSCPVSGDWPHVAVRLSQLPTLNLGSPL